MPNRCPYRISLKCQKAIISSSFNHYFGYVELDDECDLEKFFVIEQQFQALSSYLFHGKKYEEVSIRFRKLGRHRAIGLYYPYIKCLVVDVRNTDSLSHEYFHMLDFENGRVSSNYEFLKVRECYQECFMQSLEESQYDNLCKVLVPNHYKSITIKKSYYKVTDLGKLFIKSCVK